MIDLLTSAQHSTEFDLGTQQKQASRDIISNRAQTRQCMKDIPKFLPCIWSDINESSDFKVCGSEIDSWMDNWINISTNQTTERKTKNNLHIVHIKMNYIHVLYIYEHTIRYIYIDFFVSNKLMYI